MLERKLHYSKIDIIEKALQLNANKELVNQSLILKYAGVLNKQDADTMLASIYEKKSRITLR